MFFRSCIDNIVLLSQKKTCNYFFKNACFVSVSRVKFDEEKEVEGQDSALLVELEGKDEKKERETNLWFSKVCHFIYSQCSCYKMISQLPICSHHY